MLDNSICDSTADLRKPINQKIKGSPKIINDQDEKKYNKKIKWNKYKKPNKETNYDINDNSNINTNINNSNSNNGNNTINCNRH